MMIITKNTKKSRRKVNRLLCGKTQILSYAHCAPGVDYMHTIYIRILQGTMLSIVYRQCTIYQCIWKKCHYTDKIHSSIGNTLPRQNRHQIFRAVHAYVALPSRAHARSEQKKDKNEHVATKQGIETPPPAPGTDSLSAHSGYKPAIFTDIGFHIDRSFVGSAQRAREGGTRSHAWP